MRPFFKCEFDYIPTPYLNQIYDGFNKLKKAGIVDLSVKSRQKYSTKPLLLVTINNKYKVIYDTLDGFNWINGSIEDNLVFFNRNIKADFYFKRSFNAQVVKNAPSDCKVFPLGFNYNVKPENKYLQSYRETLKDLVYENFIISGLIKKRYFKSKDYEYYPIPCKENRVLFLARLWSPDVVSLEHLKTERELINRNRIACIRICKKEFGGKFVGGLQSDSTSLLYAKDLIMPLSFTKKENFISHIKDHNICIATTGLHDSIGWKFGEYVAASRAIISEPLKYQLPGNFTQGKNYLTFENTDDLVNEIYKLLKSRDILTEMMISNYHYYNNYLRTDMLVLNTLLKIYQYDSQ